MKKSLYFPLSPSFNHLILLLFVFLILEGCSTSSGITSMGNIANILGGKDGAKNKNPFIEAEIDLLLIDEISAMIKLNQVILERMPISYDDPWPELLNDYYLTANAQEMAAKQRYDMCLQERLREDFSFYRAYNLDAYLALVAAGPFDKKRSSHRRSKKEQVNSIIKDIIIHFFGALSSGLFIEGCRILGLEFEHTKAVLSRIPFGCDCPYFRKRYSKSLIVDSQFCARAKQNLKLKKCDFFYRPTELMLNRYLIHAKGIRDWIELPLPASCLRIVEGEQIGTFKEVFYSLFNPSIRQKIQTIETELVVNEANLKSIEAQLEDKELPSRQKAALKKREKIINIKVKREKQALRKLYRIALSQISITPENIKKAKKLKQITDYIDRNFRETSGVITNLTIKIIDDARYMTKKNITTGIITYPFLRKEGVLLSSNKKYYQNRFSLVMHKLTKFHINYLAILGYAIAQRCQVSRYKRYLDAVCSAVKVKINSPEKRPLTQVWQNPFLCPITY